MAESEVVLLQIKKVVINSVVYETTEVDVPVRSVYVQKRFFGKDKSANLMSDFPSEIQVTVAVN